MPATTEANVSPLLPKKPRLVGSSVYLTPGMWERLAEVAEETTREDPSSRGYSRNDIIIHYLEWALSEHDKDRHGGPRAGKGAPKAK